MNHFLSINLKKCKAYGPSSHFVTIIFKSDKKSDDRKRKKTNKQEEKKKESENGGNDLILKQTQTLKRITRVIFIQVVESGLTFVIV